MAAKRWENFHFSFTPRAPVSANALILSQDKYGCTQPTLTRNNEKNARMTRDGATEYDNPQQYTETGEFTINNDSDLQILETTTEADVVITEGALAGSAGATVTSTTGVRIYTGKMFIDSVTPSSATGIKRWAIAYTFNGTVARTVTT